jgi:hypothetical protein
MPQLKGHTCQNCGVLYSLKHRNKRKSKHLELCGKCVHQLTIQSARETLIFQKHLEATINKVNSLPYILAPIKIEKGEIPNAFTGKLDS